MRHSPRRIFTDGWMSEYEAFWGRKYLFQSAKDGMASDRILALGIPTEEIMGVAKKAWAKAKPHLGNSSDLNKHAFWSKQAASLAGFVSQFNQIRAEVDASPVREPTLAAGAAVNGF